MSCRPSCQHQLGADPVRSRDQKGLLPAIQVQVEERAEPAETGQHFGTHGAFHGRLDPFHQFIPGININACIAIGQAFFGFSRIVQVRFRYGLFR